VSENFWNFLLWPVINLAGLGFFTSLAVTGFMVLAGLGDEPDARSSHGRVTPTSGGVGLIAAFGICGVTLALLYPFLLRYLPVNFPQVLSLVFAIGLLGLCDDVFALSAKLKFGIMIILAGAGVLSVGIPTAFPFGGEVWSIPTVIGLFGALLWVFVVVNAVNFMDGANGLITNALVIASVALGVIGLSAGSVLTAFLCGVSIVGFLGFLPYNQRRDAAIFLGDAGSLVAGFAFALASLSAVNASASLPLLFLGPLLILPLLADVLLTLASRLRRGQNLLHAHRDHMYQRLIGRGMSHLQVTWIYSILALIFANISIFAVQSERISSLGFFSLNVVFISALYFLASRLIRRAS